MKAGFAALFDTLGDSGEGGAQKWAERYRDHPASKRYLAAAQKDKGTDILLEERPLVRLREKQVVESGPPAVYKVSALGQFFALSARSLKVLLRDRLAILFVLIAPLLAAGLDLVSSSRNMYDTVSGSSERVMLSSAVLVFLVMLFAGFSWTPEIRKEAAIIRHERQTSLKLVPYILAKVWIVALFTLYQALVWSGIHFFIANVPGGITAWLTFFITLASVALIGACSAYSLRPSPVAGQAQRRWCLSSSAPFLIH